MRRWPARKISRMYVRILPTLDVREDIANVNGRLDRIEHLLIEEQRRKIENLETRMKKLEDALAI
jgi:hypothetical protein